MHQDYVQEPQHSHKMYAGTDEAVKVSMMAACSQRKSGFKWVKNWEYVQVNMMCKKRLAIFILKFVLH